MSREVVIATIMNEMGTTGVQSHFNEFHHLLTSLGIASKIITPFSYSRLAVYPIFGMRKIVDKISKPLSVWWYRYWHYIFLKRALEYVLRSERSLIVYAQCPLSAKAALEARKTPRQKVIMAVHFNISQADEWAEKGMIRIGGRMYSRIKDLEASVLPLLDGIVYVSNFMKNTLENEIKGLVRVKSIVLPNFISVQYGEKSLVKRGDLVSIGTLETRKNQTYLLEVLAEARRQGREYTLTIVGDGPDRSKLKEKAKSLGVEAQVIFTGYQKNAASLLCAYKIYVHSASTENLPLTLIEALSYGLPVLAAPVGGIGEVYSDGVEGRYWALDNPKEGAERLIEIMENQTIYNNMSRAARMRFESTFDTSKIGERLVTFLCSVVAENYH